ATRVSTGWMMQMTSTLYLAYAHCASGEHEETLSVARQCRHIHALLGTADHAGPNDAGLPEAHALLMLGRLDEAESLLRERLGILARARCVTATLWMGSVMSRLFAFA